MKKSLKGQFFSIFLIAEIKKNRCESFILQKFKNPQGKNLEFSLFKIISAGDNKFYRGQLLNLVT